MQLCRQNYSGGQPGAGLCQSELELIHLFARGRAVESVNLCMPDKCMHAAETAVMSDLITLITHRTPTQGHRLADCFHGLYYISPLITRRTEAWQIEGRSGERQTELRR